MPDPLVQGLILVGQATLLAAFLVIAEHFRNTFGMAPVQIMVGALQVPQTLLASSVYLHFSDTVVISPGPSVLFTTTLFAALLVHRLEGAKQARQLIYGVFLVNLVMAVLLYSFGVQLDSSLAMNTFSLPPQLFYDSARVIMVGSIVLLLDIILVVSVYNGLARFRLSSFVQILASLCVVLGIDALLFFALNFWSDPLFLPRLTAAAGTKFLVAGICSTVLTIYLRSHPSQQPASSFLQTLRFLTFRTDIDELVKAATYDRVTGAHTRRFMEDRLFELADTANRSTWSLIIADLDHFKQVNDQHGHATGDRVLALCVGEIKQSVRSKDIVCRFGGEEFVVLMPNTDLGTAVQAAERIRSAIASMHTRTPDLENKGPFTASFGVATSGDNGTESQQIFRQADARLYQAKALGRNRVVFTENGD